MASSLVRLSTTPTPADRFPPFWTVPFTAEAPLLPISREQRLPAARSAEQVLHHQLYAGGILPVLEHGTRKYTRRGGTGQGRLADYAHIGQQYGMAAALYPGRKRAGNRSSRAGAEGKNKLYPLRKERVCKGGRCLLGTSSAFFVGEFYVRRIIL